MVLVGPGERLGLWSAAEAEREASRAAQLANWAAPEQVVAAPAQQEVL